MIQVLVLSNKKEIQTMCTISKTNLRPCLITSPNNEARGETTICSGDFLTSFKAFGNVVKQCLAHLISCFAIET